MVYLFAGALANIYQENGGHHPIEIWQDVRESGIILVDALRHGFETHHVATLYRGIAPTSLYAIRHDRWVVVVTASHNPVAFNGLKVFREGRAAGEVSGRKDRTHHVGAVRKLDVAGRFVSIRDGDG